MCCCFRLVSGAAADDRRELGNLRSPAFAMASVSETKLFVGRLPADARIEEVEDVFAAFGKIVKIGDLSTAALQGERT